ncbi:RNA polymerase factor sigma-54 [Robertmurraya korlensis]|uniref:RNA polymerase factor sigma-54 n=1 Tax=Robertmurraya korlensis TaxID=519977 RepID=UPI0008252A97|nr:RNA polymerase factor sigma-54 [Robertmurraya korlensis]
MNLKAGLWQQQTLKLKMTQELSQAITLLQYSSQELTAFLESKALENPLIQIETSHIKTMDPRKDRPKKTRVIDKDQQNWIEQIGKSTTTLYDHLYAQVVNHSDVQLLRALLEYIDGNGYIGMSNESLATQLGILVEQVEALITIIQELEPAGVGARSLGECLYLQLIQMPKRNPLAEKLVSDHFEEFAEKKWKSLSKQLVVSLSDIQAAFDLIQTLNPRPGADFHEEAPLYVVPDVSVKWDGQHFEISVFDDVLPKLTFQQDYYQQFAAVKDTSLNKYLQEKQQDYSWIARSLEQRKETITKVSLAIVQRQQEFFEKGPLHLKPMTMREIAEEIDVHESTVSRAVREKYMQTPFGTLELKSFFTNMVSTTNSEATSSNQVKDSIKRLIDGEDKAKPYSDQEILAILKETDGFVISRRTVAKYRDQLGIPSSSKRKRF